MTLLADWNIRDLGFLSEEYMDYGLLKRDAV